ncbi:MAG: TolC family protein [Puia sp.]|nr:TolC family protein [Puia sp.]
MTRLFFGGLCLCFLGEQVAAQVKPDTVVIGSLQEAISLAIKHNPTQAVYQQQIRQAHFNYKAAQGAFYPNASAAFGATDNLYLAVTPVPGVLVGAPGTTDYVQFGKHYVYNTGVTLAENVFNWQAVMATKIARDNVMVTESQQASYIQSLKEQVARTYFSALIAKGSLKIIGSDEQAGDSLVSLARQRLQEGASDALSVNEAVINANNVLENKAQSQQLYDQGSENLKTLLGVNALSELVFREDIQTDSMTNAADLPLGTDKYLDFYRNQVSLAELQRQSQKSVAYPSLSASAFLGLNQFQDNFELSFDNSAWTKSRYVSLNLSIPLFTGLANTNNYKSSVERKIIAQLRYDSAVNQSAVNDRLLVKNHNDYGNMVRASAENFDLYAANLQLSKQKYQEGIITLDTYLKAFQDYLTAEDTWLNNLSQLLSVRATILSRQ